MVRRTVAQEGRPHVEHTDVGSIDRRYPLNFLRHHVVYSLGVSSFSSVWGNYTFGESSQYSRNSRYRMYRGVYREYREPLMLDSDLDVVQTELGEVLFLQRSWNETE